MRATNLRELFTDHTLASPIFFQLTDENSIGTAQHGFDVHDIIVIDPILTPGINDLVCAGDDRRISLYRFGQERQTVGTYVLGVVVGRCARVPHSASAAQWN